MGRKHRYVHNIYNTEDKLYILKLNGFKRFPGKLFTSTIVVSEISCVTRFSQNSQSVLVSYTSKSNQNVLYRKKPDFCTEIIETTNQDSELSWEMNYTKSRILLIFNPGKSLGR